MPSTSRVMAIMARTSLTMPSKLSTLRASRTRLRPRKLIRRPAAMASPMLTEDIPRPPSCISTASTAWPNSVKVSPGSTVTSPVTQTALVAVNRASSPGSCPAPRTAMGSESSAAPMKMSTAKPKAMVRAGDCCFVIFLKFSTFSPVLRKLFPLYHERADASSST